MLFLLVFVEFMLVPLWFDFVVKTFAIREWSSSSTNYVWIQLVLIISLGHLFDCRFRYLLVGVQEGLMDIFKIGSGRTTMALKLICKGENEFWQCE